VGDRLDWGLLLQRAREFRWAPALHAALQGAQERFQTPLPPEFLAALTEVRDQEAVRLVKRKAGALQTRSIGAWNELGALDWPARLRLAWAIACPLPTDMQWRYTPRPTWAWPLYYPYRWLGILGDGLSTLTQLMGRAWGEQEGDCTGIRPAFPPVVADNQLDNSSPQHYNPTTHEKSEAAWPPLDYDSEGDHASLMRIGIDARILGYRRAGIGQYTYRLVEALAEIDQDDEFIIFQSRRDGKEIVQHPNFHRQTLYTPSHHRLEQWVLPLELWRHQLDLLHSPDFIPPFHRRHASVITVHDLGFLHFPHFVTQDSAQHYGLIDQAVRRTDHIIAVSGSTKTDIINLLGVDERKITVIHEATTPDYHPRVTPDEMAAVSEVCERYGLHRPFILFVSTIEPRKNLPTLLRAFRRLRDEYRVGVELVVVGERGWLSEDVFTLTTELQLTEAAKFLGRVPAHDLPLLYNAAMVHVHPSFYEGFGLTPLEAMSSGTPTIVSNVSSLPEVVGDAGLLVAPDDVAEWTVAIWRLLTDSALRETMIEKGLKRAATFSWEKAAQQHLSIYRRFRNGR